MVSGLEMFAWRTKAAVSVEIGDNIIAYFSQMKLVALRYVREIYTGIEKEVLIILEDDELLDKQSRHVLELKADPDPYIYILDETDFETHLAQVGANIFTSWAYAGPTVVGDPELNFTGEEIEITFNVDMHAAPTLAGWTFSVNGGTARAFDNIDRKMGDARTYVLFIASDEPDWDDVVTISYDCFVGTAQSQAEVKLGLLTDFAVDNTREEPPTIVSAETNVAGTVISVQCSEDMADPAGKHGQFSWTQDGAIRTFSAAALDGVDSSIIDLTIVGTPIPDGSVIELAVTASPMFILADGRWGYLRDEADIEVVNTSLVPTPIGAELAIDGESIIVEFNKSMADPAGKHGEFEYKIDGGAGQAFSVAALDSDDTKLVLTCNGDLPVFGEEVTVSYTVGTVVADDGGVLASFADYAVDSLMEESPVLISAETDDTTMVLEFDKDMASPAGEHALFTYKIGDGEAQSFSAVALDGTDSTKFELTLDGDVPVHGNTVTVSFDGASRAILADDGGILDTFADEEVTNTIPE